MIDTDKLVLLDFSALWCRPCRAQEPILEELQEEYNDILEVRKIDIDKNTELANQYSIRSVPTMVFLRNGEFLDAITGLTTKRVLAEKVIRYS